MEQEAEEYFQKIDALGGVIPAIKQGFFQREIAAAARQYQQEIEKKDRLIVGVNAYAEPDEKLDIPILKVDPKVESEQNENLKKLRSQRENTKVRQTLDQLKIAAQEDRNLMLPLIDCSRAYCTLGEMINVLKGVYGTWREEPVF
jgi:methylmalonyl-CoA mutase N-terminal domain/subunit